MSLMKCTLWVCAGALLVVSVEPALGFLNHGFETDYVYPLLETGELRVCSETGTYVKELVTGSLWWAGTRQGIHEIKANDTIFQIDNVNGRNGSMWTARRRSPPRWGCAWPGAARGEVPTGASHRTPSAVRGE